jgi:hypothetical protein
MMSFPLGRMVPPSFIFQKTFAIPHSIIFYSICQIFHAALFSHLLVKSHSCFLSNQVQSEGQHVNFPIHNFFILIGFKWIKS